MLIDLAQKEVFVNKYQYFFFLSQHITKFFISFKKQCVVDAYFSATFCFPLFPSKMSQHSFSSIFQKLSFILLSQGASIMELNSIMNNNSTQKSSIQSPFQRYHIDISLPFSINSSYSRKWHRYERDGHWNEKERLKYSVFLTFFCEILQDPAKKKGVRIYDMMSDMIVTRNSNQCRSHHQKMEKYRSTVTDIVASVAEKYEPSVYHQLSQRYLALIRTLLENSRKYIRTSTEITDKASQKKIPAIGRTTEDRNRSCQEQEQQLREVEVPQEFVPEIKCEYKPIEELLLEKIKLQKKTADSYEEKQPHQDQIDLPMMSIDGLSDDEKGYQEPLGLQQNIINPIQAHPQNSRNPTSILAPPQPINGYSLDSGSRVFYEQQVASLEIRRQWHVQNAEQLYRQWNSQVQNIKLCDQSIKIYSQMLRGNRSSSQRA